MQIIAWAIALLFGDTYAGLIAAIILVDIGLQCQQLSNQSGCLQEIPQASNRANTIFMTTYFIGGSRLELRRIHDHLTDDQPS